MSIQMDTMRAILHLAPSPFESEQRLRRTLQFGRPDAPVPWWLHSRCAREVWRALAARWRLRPARPSNMHIVYLHGGAFVYPPLPMHWWIIAALMNRTGATVTVPSYRLGAGVDLRQVHWRDRCDGSSGVG